MINEILIYYRLRTLGGNLLHKILSPWLFAVSMGLSSFILSSLASLKPQLFMSSFENERKTLKIIKALVPHFLSLLPAIPHPLFMLSVDLPALSKGVGADPCECQKGASLFLKTHFGLILDDSRRNLDVDGSLLGGSCIPKVKELIPWWEELILLKEGFIPLKEDLVTSLHCTINSGIGLVAREVRSWTFFRVNAGGIETS